MEEGEGLRVPGWGDEGAASEGGRREEVGDVGDWASGEVERFGGGGRRV